MREKEDFIRYSKAVNADFYRVTAKFMPRTEAARAFILDKSRSANGTLTPGETLERMGRMRYLQDDKGYNIYLTPISEKKHRILIDDLTQ